MADFDSAALKPENRETLSRIAGVLLAGSGIADYPESLLLQKAV